MLGVASIALIVVVGVLEVVVRLRFRSRGAFSVLLLRLPRWLLLRSWFVMSLSATLLVGTLLVGIYATRFLVPTWGAQWLPAVVGIALAVVLFPDTTDTVHLALTEPVVDAIEAATWPADFRETQFRDQLCVHLSELLGVQPRPERPLPTGSRVDVWLEYEGFEYFVSLKRLRAAPANQQRLIVQGEIEDILRDVEDRRVRRFHIVVVIGFTPDERRALYQVQTLDEQICRRVREASDAVPTVIEMELQPP